jgi:hypothetical protein
MYLHPETSKPRRHQVWRRDDRHVCVFVGHWDKELPVELIIAAGRM